MVRNLHAFSACTGRKPAAHEIMKQKKRSLPSTSPKTLWNFHKKSTLSLPEIRFCTAAVTPTPTKKVKEKATSLNIADFLQKKKK